MDDDKPWHTSTVSSLQVFSLLRQQSNAAECELAGVFLCRFDKYYSHDWLLSGKFLPDRCNMAKAQRIDFEDLKARADFRAVLLHYRLALVGQGDQAKVLCPFHDDERPSCSVNLVKGLWHCFRGCGAGNVLDFVHRMETKDGATVSLRQAGLRLSEIGGVNPGAEMPVQGRQEPRRTPTAKGTVRLRAALE